MNEKKWLTRAALFVGVLGLINLMGILRPVWLLAATVFSLYLVIHNWIAEKVNKVKEEKEVKNDYVLPFVLILFLAVFGYFALNTNIDVALKNNEHLSGRVNDTLSLIVLGITLALYIRK